MSEHSNLNDTPISKSKQPKYPKELKKKDNYTQSKITNISKISGIKELRKIWSTEHRPKSDTKYKKFRKEKFDEELSKKEILTLINDDKNIIKEKLDNNNIQIDNFNQNDFNGKEIKYENINNVNNININTNKYFKYYEDGLLVNLHKTNNRRTTTQEETKVTKNGIIKGDNDGFKAKTKSILIPNGLSNFNENMNGNNIINMNDKVRLI